MSEAGGRRRRAGRRESSAGSPPGAGEGGRGLPRAAALAALALAALAGPDPAAAQGDRGGGGSAVPEFGGLLIAGFRAEPEESAAKSGFELFHARLRATGRSGLGVRYRVQAGFDPESREVSLLDARLEIPVRPGLGISAGQFKAPFGREALIGPGELQFARRSQATAALAPLRQVGAELSGKLLDRRLEYRAGAFNGEGRTAGNPDGEMLYAARVEFSRLGGPVKFYDELNVTVGASVAFSEDSARDVSAAGPFRPPIFDATSFRGDRLLWGGDLELGYRGFFAAAEYLRGEFDPEPAASDPAADGTQTARGIALEGGYKLWGGAVDLLGRWDAFDPPAADRRDFLVFGANLYPGTEARIGLQYAARLDDGAAAPTAPGGLGSALSPGPRPLPGGLADGQFVLRLQTGF